MSFQEKSTAEILRMILSDSNTESALEIYLFAKKVANAASVAMTLCQEDATRQLIERGGKGENHFAKFHIKRDFSTVFQPDVKRDGLMEEIEKTRALIKGYSTALSEIEKEMVADGRAEKSEVGQSIAVSLLDKI